MSKAQEVREKVDRGEMDMYESMKVGLTLYSRALDKSSMSARRARIRRQWEAEGQDWVIDEEFEEEEKAALATLKEARFMAGFQEFSDDKGEEEAESGSRSEKTTANEVQEDEDEDTMDEVEDDQNIDTDRFVSDDQDVEEGEDVNDDEDVKEESGVDKDNEGGVGSGHHQEH